MEERKRYLYEHHFFDAPQPCGGIDLLQLGEMICHPATVIPCHEQCCWEITYVLEGKGVVITDGCETAVEKGDCVLSRPGDLHAIVSDRDEPLRYAFCGFAENGSDGVWPRIIAELTRLFRSPEERSVRLSEESNCFFGLFSEIASEEFMARERIGIRLADFAVGLIRARRMVTEKIYASRIPNGNMLAYQVRSYLTTHICELKNLAELPQIFNYSYHYIAKCFKEVVGQTLNEYRHSCRMEYSRALLDGGRSVTEVSELLRYSSIHVFTRSFKKQFGIPPGEYRRSRR